MNGNEQKRAVWADYFTVKTFGGRRYGGHWVVLFKGTDKVAYSNASVWSAVQWAARVVRTGLDWQGREVKFR